MVYYRHCKLVKETSTSLKEMHSWIPEQFAQVGQILKLRDADRVWENGWKVVESGNRLEEKLVPDFHSLIKSHRTATGDSLKK